MRLLSAQQVVRAVTVAGQLSYKAAADVSQLRTSKQEDSLDAELAAVGLGYWGFVG